MINLSQILSYLPETKIRELELITQRITDTGKAEMVVLFGSYARGNYREKRGQNQGKKSDYDILAVVESTTTKYELISVLREAFNDIQVPVQPVVETISYINQNLEDKQYFFSDIKREGRTLYNPKNIELSDPIDLSPARRREIAEQDFKNWYKEAEESWEEANNAIKRNSNKRASFHLQQVAEMCYTTIEMVFTHYNPYEHNLETLRKRVIIYDSRVKEVLPYETEQQKDLFDYLNFAYIGGRYRSEDEFPVTREKLDYWCSEVKKLLEITEAICLERVEGLKEIEGWG